MSPIPCFWLDNTDRVQRTLRRYRGSTKDGFCLGPYSYHNGHSPFDECPAEYSDRGTILASSDRHKPPSHDPRWPSVCDHCSYTFEPTDEWQLFQEMIFVRKDTGEEMTLRDCPPGAMWDASWYDEKGPDGKSLVVRTPGGDWHVDGEAKGGGGWTRTGEVPLLTVTPSILQPSYHGWLREGFLVSC